MCACVGRHSYSTCLPTLEGSICACLLPAARLPPELLLAPLYPLPLTLPHNPLLRCSGATATARSAFVEDAGAVLAQLSGEDAPADVSATGSRRLLATCDSRCPIWTCSYREKVVVNFGCFKLRGNPASFGYQVRYRKGRSGGAPTGRYPCNNPTWYANYKGGTATCPTCQTSTYTMLDCNWP